MASKLEFPLSLIIKAVDQATAPLRALNQRFAQMTEPVRRLNNSFKALAAEAGLPQMGKALAAVVGSVRNVAREAVALGFKLTAMAAGGAFALYRLAQGVIGTGDKLAVMAQRVGLSVDAYAQLQFAAGQANVDQEQFNAAMDHFTRGLGQAKAYTGPLFEGLSRFSPVLAMQVRNATDAESALGLMMKAFVKVQDPMKRAAIAAAVFGRSGLQMGQFLGQGEEAIEKARRRFAEIAGSQKEYAERSRAAQKAMRESEAAFEGLRAAAATGLLPALTELAHALADVFVKHRGEIAAWGREAGVAISAWVKGGGLKDLVQTMRDWAGIIHTLFDLIGGLKGVLIAVGAYLSYGLVVALAGAAKALWAFGSFMLGTPIGWFLGALALLGVAVYMVVSRWKYFKLFFKLLWEDVVGFFEAAWKKIKPIVDAVVGVAGAIGGGIKAAFNYTPSWAHAEEERPNATAGFSPLAPEKAPRSEAHVTVDFSNLPRGARVAQGKENTADLDLSLGYSLVTPG